MNILELLQLPEDFVVNDPYLSTILERVTRNTLKFIDVLYLLARKGYLPSSFTLQDILLCFDEYEILQDNGGAWANGTIVGALHKYSAHPHLTWARGFKLVKVDPDVKWRAAYRFDII